MLEIIENHPISQHVHPRKMEDGVLYMCINDNSLVNNLQGKVLVSIAGCMTAIEDSNSKARFTLFINESVKVMKLPNNTKLQIKRDK
jgi:hypothetical protein